MEQNVLKQKGKKRKTTKKPLRKSTQVRGLNPYYKKPSPNFPDVGDAVHITGKGANKNERGTVLGYTHFSRGWRVKIECQHNGQHYFCFASPYEFDVVRKTGSQGLLAAGRVNPKKPLFTTDVPKWTCPQCGRWEYVTSHKCPSCGANQPARDNPKTKWPPEAAIKYARNEGITFSDMEDYHTLSNSKVYILTELAKSVGYQKPKTASGSRTRYFYYYLKRKSKK